ncbi:EFR1 family ferrodoxin [Haliovirga abyssi]|uniref:(4Fe-4S)-binding protein n=1 Tax=Haliovirga abyssi TaxID=2996794 RepID=A0AAU9DGS1_9FUSO|nr:EFR1 family ferrodoxin [Haliovirga abyssi]BDU51473.1 (4Fe-4S)-binding protein [Haliovirga abyssi]
MKGLGIYFSGTGNTKFLMEKFKEKFDAKGVSVDLQAIDSSENFEDKYDFYIFSAPIYAEFFPKIYVDWVEKNVNISKGKKAILTSTLGSKGTPPALKIMAKILEKKGFEIIIQQEITMPNNWTGEVPSEEKIKESKEITEIKVEKIIEKFFNNEKMIKNPWKLRYWLTLPLVNLMENYLKKWATKNMSVDSNVCIGCKKCEENCPVDNLKVDGNSVNIGKNCVACMRCVNSCPVNAFRIKGKEKEQYKF